MLLDIQTTIFMICLVYAVLHASTWLALQEYRSTQVKLWSISGLVSGIAVVLLSLRGHLPEFVFYYVAQFLMLIGNWGRMVALRMYLPGSQRQAYTVYAWMNVAYFVAFSSLVYTGENDWAALLLFNGFYAILCLDYFRMGEMLHHIKPSLGARLLKWAGLSFTMSLAVRTVGVATHTDIENIYDPSVDQGVMIVGQFVAVTLSNIAFLRIFLEIAEEKKIALTHELAVTQERAEVMQQTGAELKRLLDEREEIIRQLAIFNKTAGMGALVASLAHELNQPLTAIQLNAEFIDTALQSQRPLDSEDIQDAMQDLMKENQRAASIITTLRNLFGSGKKLITVFSLNALIEDVVLLCQIKLSARNIQLRLNLPTEPLEVAGDKAQMQQVVLNLMTNAIEALEGCDRANPCIDVSLTRVDTSVALTVRDPGAGIPQDVADSVFDLFRTSKDQGMGVGLWLSRTIVESHRGTIRFETRVNEGTTFTVTLPLAIGDMIY